MSILMSAGGRGSVASVDTAGEGGFWGGVVFVGTGHAAGLPFAVANQVYCLNMVLPFRCVVGEVNSEVTTLQAGQFYGLGLYDMNGNLVVRTDAISAASVGDLQSDTTATVTVEPGPYWYCYSADDTGIGLRRWNLDGLVGSSDIARILFTAANASVAGVLPATLGVLSGSNNGVLMPVAYFTP